MIIEIPDKGLELEFPDDMPQEEITAIIQRDVYGEQPESGLSVETDEQDPPQALPTHYEELAGRGLIHGTMGLGESVGLGLQYGGERVSQFPEQMESVTEARPDAVMSTLSPSDQARVGQIMSEKDIPLSEAISLVRDYEGKKPAFKESGLAISDVGKTTAGFWEGAAKAYEPPKDIANKNVVDNPEMLANPEWWVYSTADMIPSLAASLVPGAGAHRAISVGGKAMNLSPGIIKGFATIGAAVTGGAAGGSLEGSQTYKAVLDEINEEVKSAKAAEAMGIFLPQRQPYLTDEDEQQAARAAEMMTAFSSGLNALSTGNLLSKAAPGFMGMVRKFGLNAAVEGISEGAEEPAEVVAKIGAKLITGQKVPDNVAELFYQSLKEAATVAPIAGLTGGLGGLASNADQEQDILNRDDGKWIDEINTALEGDQQGVSTDTGALGPTEQQVQNQDIIDETEIGEQGFAPADPGGLSHTAEQQEERHWEREEENILNQRREGARRNLGMPTTSAAIAGNEVDILQQDKEVSRRMKPAGLQVPDATPLPESMTPNFEVVGNQPRGLELAPVEEPAETVAPFQMAPPVERPMGPALQIDHQPAIPLPAPGQEAMKPAQPDQGVVVPPLRPEPVVDVSPIQYRPPGDRWYTDMGATPGEPSYILDDDKAAIIERHEDDGKMLFEAVLNGGQSLGSFQEIGQAAEAAEKAVDNDIDTQAHEAATSPKNDLPEPTEAQKEAGNYKKGHVKIQGLDIAIENPDGSTRSGVSPDGKKWETTMHGHYGYFKRSEGKDGDQVDVFIGTDAKKKHSAYIVDQVDPSSRKFDEHKVIMGVDNIRAAKKLYMANYEKGWKGFAGITKVEIPELKAWLAKGKQTKPYSSWRPAQDLSHIDQAKAEEERIYNEKPKPLPKSKHGDLAAMSSQETKEREWRKRYRAAIKKTAAIEDAKQPVIKKTANSQEIPIDQLIPRHPQKDMAKLERGRKFMDAVERGEGEPRAPVSVYQRLDGKYKVLEGNTTYHLLKERGAENVTVEVKKTLKQQGVKSLARLYDYSLQHVKDHRSLTEQFANETGGQAKYRPEGLELKSRARAQEKVEVYGYYDRLKDILASSLVFKTEKALLAAVKKVSDDYHVAEVEDRWNNPTGDGYRDFVLIVTHGDGRYLAEIQLMTNAMFDAKMGIGHELFELGRSTNDADIQGVVSKLSRKLYGEAYDSEAKDFAISKALSLEIATDLDEMSKLKGISTKSFGPSIRNILRDFASTAKGTPSDLTYDSDMGLSPSEPNVKHDTGTSKEKPAKSLTVEDSDTNLGTRQQSDKGLKDDSVDSSRDQGDETGGTGDRKSSDRSVLGASSDLADGQRAGSNREPVPDRQESPAQPATESRTKGQAESDRSDQGEKTGSGSDQGSGDADRGAQRRKSDTGQPANTDEGRPSRQNTRVESKPELKPEDKNHVIEPGDLIFPRGPETKIKANIKAIRLLKKLEKEDRNPSPAEKKILAQYVGWGQFAQKVFKRGYDNFVKDAAEEPDSYWSKPENKFNTYDGSLDKFNNWKTRYGKKLHPALKGLLTQEEWDSAAESTQNAHYTSRRVIEVMWSMAKQMGFKGGTVVEPAMGPGHFFGLMPDDVADNSRLVGVELDSITARIAKKLYPQAHIQESGFEKATGIPDNGADLVISNFPFGSYSVYDSKHKEYSKWAIHNYFFGRSIDAVRPGGLVMSVTSHWTMDAVSKGQIREALKEKADLIAAVRLPYTTFKKDAGTEVTTDILIFRKKDGTYGLGNDFRVVVGVDSDKKGQEADVNEYFANHPENVLGRHSLKGTMRGGENEYTLLPEGDLDARMNEAIGRLPADIAGEGTIAPLEEKIYADTGAKEGTLTEKDGGLFMVEDGLLVEPKIYNSKGELVPALSSRPKKLRARAYLKIREATKELINQSQQEGVTDKEIDALRVELDKLYDEYTSKYKGFGDSSNSFLRKLDNEFPIVDALEDEDVEVVQTVVKSGPNKGMQRKVQKTTFTKAAILKRRTIWPFVPPDHAETVDDALKISRIYRGRVDVGHMADLLGMDKDDVQRKLLEDESAYLNPETGLVEAPDEYLSGNVKKKLEKAKYAGLDTNIKALEAVLPDDIDIEFIHFKLGSSWIPEGAVADFLKKTMNVTADVRQVRTGETVSWVINTRSGVIDAKNTETWGVPDRRGDELVTDCLNLKRSRVMESYWEDGKRRYRLDKDASIAAQAKQSEIQEEFRQWARSTDKWAGEMSTIYNREFNGTVLRKFDTPDIARYPGAAETITLRPTQKKFVYRALQESTIFAHGVGTGKTFSYISTAMEMRRLKTARKPLIVVQNATVRQYSTEFKLLYPQAKVLIPLDNQRKGKQRKKLLVQIATGDWDAVVLPHSFFDGIADDPAREVGFVREQLDEIEEAIEAAEAGDGDEYTVKDMKAMRKRKQARLEKLLDRRKDDALTFEQLGVDALLIDEAHAYKRSEFFTKMGTVKGIDQGSAQRSTSLLLKARYVQSKTGGKNVLLATGTVISNTTAELWTMIRYVRPDLLKEYNAELFDDFAANFGDTTVTIEETDTGTFKEVERFNKYVNGPELLSMFHTAADVVLTKGANLNLPDVKGGQPESMVVERYDALTTFIDNLRDQREAWEQLGGREKRAQRHVPLVLFGQAKKAAVDLRLIDPNYYSDEPDSKLNQVVENAFDIWQQSASDRSTQVIFLDTFQSSDKSFNAHQDIKTKLAQMGVPEKELIVVKDASDIKRDAWFQRVRDGVSRVIIGTTPRLGIGVNIQDKLIAAHHVDAPMRPMDIEQRNGRIVREGNENAEVQIFNYGVKNTLDSVMYDRLTKKQRFIDQVLTGDIEGRTFDEPLGEEQVSFAEMNAAFAGNPLLFEKSDMTVKVKNLRVLQNSWRRKVSNAKKSVRELRTGKIPRAKKKLKQNIELVKQVDNAFPDGKVAEIQFDGKAYSPKEFVKKINELIEAQANTVIEWASDLTIGDAHKLGRSDLNNLKNQYSLVAMAKIGPFSFTFKAVPEIFYESSEVTRKPSKKVDFDKENPFSAFRIFFGKKDDALFNVTRSQFTNEIWNAVNKSISNVKTYPQASREFIERLESDLVEMEKAAAEPYKKADELEQAEQRLTEIDNELQQAAGTTAEQSAESDQAINAMTEEMPALVYPQDDFGKTRDRAISDMQTAVIDLVHADIPNLYAKETRDMRSQIGNAKTPKGIVEAYKEFMGHYDYDITRKNARIIEDLRKNAQERIDQASLVATIGEPIQGIPQRLKDAITNASGSIQMATDIINAGIELKRKMPENYRRWRANMRRRFDAVWDKISTLMHQLWDSITHTLSNQSGALRFDLSKLKLGDSNPDFINEKFGRSTKSVGEKVKEVVDIIITKDSREELLDVLTTQGLDRLHPTKRTGDRAYKLHRIQTGDKASFAMLMQHGKLEWDPSGFMTVKSRGEGFIPWLRSLGNDWNKFFYWVAARRAEVLDTEGRESWLDANTRAKIFEWAGGRQNRKWVKAAGQLREFNASVLDLAEQAGLIEPSARAVWEQDHYVPFYRIFEDDAQREEFLKAPRKNKRYISAQIKRLHGAEQKLGDPLENLLHNWTHLISESMRNVARAEAYDFSMDAGDGLIEDAKPTDIYSFQHGQKNKKTVYMSKKENAPVLMFQRDGQPVYFVVHDPQLFYAMSEINAAHFNNWLLKLFGGSKRLLTRGATFGPAFRLANLMRDTGHTALLEKSFKPVFDSAIGFVKAMREDQDFIQFMASGAGFGASYVEADNPQVAAKFIRKIVKREGQGAVKRILDTPKKMLAFWEKIGAASENAARVQLYSKLMKGGETHTDAAFRGRDLLDFTMRGESRTVQLLVQTVPFLNARMQGLYKLGRAVADKNNRTNFAIRGALLAAASLALWWVFKDDDRYKELEDWERWAYYHFWIGDKHFRIPKPFEVGALFSSLPETIANVMNGNDESTHIIDFIGHTAYETLAIDLPQLVAPMIEQWADKSFFTDRPLVSRNLEGLVTGEQADPWTSESLQLLGEKMGISPKRAEHLINSYLATFGDLIVGSADILVNTLYEFPENPDTRIDDLPLVGRFVREDGPARHTKQMTWFYNTFNEISKLSKTLNSYETTGRLDKAMKLVNTAGNPRKIAMQRKFYKFRKAISETHKRIRQVWYDQNMSKEDKRKQIDALMEARNKAVNLLYEQYITFNENS